MYLSMNKETEESLERLTSVFKKYNSLEKEGKITEAKEVGSKLKRERKIFLDLLSKGRLRKKVLE